MALVLCVWLQVNTNSTTTVSTTGSGGTTAVDAIEQYLQTNPGWHEVAEIANATGYSHGHTLTTGTSLAADNTSPVERRKNRSKPVVAYILNGNSEVPGSDPQRYIDLIRRHSTSPPSNLGAMSLDQLQTQLRKVASGTTVFEWKVEFRIP